MKLFPTLEKKHAKWRLLAIIICLLSSTLTFAQQKEHIEWEKNQLKFSPLRTINWFTPGLELGYQRNYKYFASQISVAYLTNIADITKLLEREDVHGYRLNFEEKYYFPKSYIKRQRTFISCKISYNDINSTRPSQRFIPKDNEWDDYTNSYIDDYKINRQSITFDIKTGIEFQQIKHLFLEWGVGIGIAYHNIRQLNKKNPDYKKANGRHDFLSPMFEAEGQKILPNMPITFKICYTF